MLPPLLHLHERPRAAPTLEPVPAERASLLVTESIGDDFNMTSAPIPCNPPPKGQNWRDPRKCGLCTDTWSCEWSWRCCCAYSFPMCQIGSNVGWLGTTPTPNTCSLGGVALVATELFVSVFFSCFPCGQQALVAHARTKFAEARNIKADFLSSCAYALCCLSCLSYQIAQQKTDCVSQLPDAGGGAEGGPN